MQIVSKMKMIRYENYKLTWFPFFERWIQTIATCWYVISTHAGTQCDKIAIGLGVFKLNFIHETPQTPFITLSSLASVWCVLTKPEYFTKCTVMAFGFIQAHNLFRCKDCGLFGTISCTSAHHEESSRLKDSAMIRGFIKV